MATDPATSTENAVPKGRRWLRSPLAMMLLGSLLLWLAQPGSSRLLGIESTPLGLLGWVAAAPWVWVAARPSSLSRWGYAQVWLGGWCYWAATLYWICFPHPLTPLGWPLLAGYLAVYPLAFVAVTRLVARRGAAPLWLAAPLAWTGLELAQAHLFTGFLMGALAHTQANCSLAIQISDLTGAYGVSFLLAMTGAWLVVVLRRDAGRAQKLSATTVTAATLLAAFYYGHVRLQEASASSPGPMVAIVQGNTLATWDPSEGRDQQILDAQLRLTRQAARLAEERGATIDLFVWPESMFRAPVITVDNQPTPIDRLPDLYQRFGRASEEWFGGLATEHGAAFLLGVDRFDVAASDEAGGQYDQTVYNTAALIAPDGRLTSFYDKTHRVPFGEYIPFAKNMPALYFLTPMTGGLGEGAGPVCMPLETAAGTVLLAPNICYETVIPHVIRRQVATLTDQGEAPDLLVNITNDAWFWGATELDLHLAVGQFRAVENRTPMVVAANTGLSAVVDGSGRVLHKSERMQEEVIVAAAPLDNRGSFYSRHGDWFALACVVVTVGLLLTSLAKGEGRTGEAGHAAEFHRRE